MNETLWKFLAKTLLDKYIDAQDMFLSGYSISEWNAFKIKAMEAKQLAEYDCVLELTKMLNEF